MSEHMLQAAQCAEQAGAGEDMVAAALLHDIGHWLPPGKTQSEGAQRDAHHEILGAAHLAQYFGEDVEVRKGPDTGELEIYNPKLGKFMLINKPGLDAGDFGATIITVISSLIFIPSSTILNP